ncbi:MAG: hypothetical protein IPG84_17595 [Betaproteobacteria bacterium]|nr:hypothetical protein [Betaproteobacteria bacterium]
MISNAFGAGGGRHQLAPVQHPVKLGQRIAPLERQPLAENELGEFAPRQVDVHGRLRAGI